MAQITICGRLGQDPELLELGGTPACKFSVAESVRRKRGGQWQNETQWYSVTVWRAPAEWIARDGRKGAWIYVEGDLDVQEFQGRDGVQRTKVCVDARKAQVLRTEPREDRPQSRARSVSDEVPF